MPTATLRLVLALVLLVPAAVAQQTGNCVPGTADAYLEINDVRARLFNTGALFWRAEEPAIAQYFVPKETGRAPIFAEHVQVAGKVEGEIRAATGAFSPHDFWPGPLGEGGAPPEDCAAYDRIYLVSRADIAQYDETGIATDDLADWPAHLGAPVIDGDGVEGNYDLAGGDRPAISGEQMAWWVMNDAGNEHLASGTPPLGLEVQVSAFALPSPLPALDQATLYRYRFVNRSSARIDSAYAGFFGWMDLGDALGTMVVSDTTRHMAYVYHDEGLDEVYGPDPPAFGRLYLETPTRLGSGKDEPLGMTASMFFWNGTSPPILDEYTGPEMYWLLKGHFTDGTPITEGGNGYMTNGDTTTFMFPGDPVTGQGWNVDWESQGRSLSSTGPFALDPGESVEVVFALVFAQGEDHMDSLVELRVAADRVRAEWEDGVFNPHPVSNLPEPGPLRDAALAAFPNPFRDEATLTLTVPERTKPLRLVVYDVLGREVAVLAEGVLPPGEHALTLDGAGLPSGLYLVRLETGRQAETLSLTLIR